jgi:phosphatidylglycerophosphatase GEP4
MIFIGDRYLTDVVFGNRHGMLTIRVAPLTSKGEPPGVLVARQVEEFCVRRWLQQGVKPLPHGLIQPEQLVQVVKESKL